MPQEHDRHAQSKWEWGSEPSRSAQRAAAAAEPDRRTPGRKDRRRWCRGKPGAEHVPELTVVSSFTPRGQPGSCYWAPRYYARRGSPPLSEQPVSWSCVHRETCAACGKVLRERCDLKTEECPLYPGDPAQRRAAEAKAAEWAGARPIKPWRRKPPPDGPSHYRRPRG